MRPRAILASTEFLGAALFLFAVLFPPFDDATAVDMSVHMLQHVTILLSGVMVGYPLYKKGLIPRPSGQAVPAAVLVAVSAGIVYWHFPGPWDAAVLNPWVHAAEHLCFLLEGVAIGSVALALSDSAKVGALAAASFGHMGYALLLIAPWNLQVYSVYPLADQQVLGFFMLITGWLPFAGVVYMMMRNPKWLEGLGRKATRRAPSGAPGRPRVPQWAKAGASVLLLVVLVGYYSATAVAITLSPAGPAHQATVYIDETPISWQFYPQSITVVVGVNNTVTWKSHSVSYDTVTSDDGAFTSGNIAPGGSFTYTFDRAGVYGYHCIYHPWMVGNVTVLAAS